MNRQLAVFVIESPADHDLLVGRQEGYVLCQGINMAEGRCQVFLAASRSTFQNALMLIHSSMKECKTEIHPVIHISAHGDHAGIELTDRSRIEWKELASHLSQINQDLDNQLTVVFSSCEGAAGSCMAAGEDRPPFRHVVCNSKHPTWSETAVAFACFYLAIGKGKSHAQALHAMREGSGNNDFVHLDIETSRTIAKGVLASATLRA